MHKSTSIKQISISFENKLKDQKIAKYIKGKKTTVGVSEYVKQLVIREMEKEHLI